MNLIKDFANNTLYGNYLTSIFRIFIGLLFIYSSSFKILDLYNFGNIIILYDIIPKTLAPYAAIIMPVLELIIGILLVIGFRIKPTSLLTGILFIFFIIIISINIYRGNNFDCGCFDLSQFGIDEKIGFPLLIRDIIFLFILFLILYAKRHPFSIDKIVEEKNLNRL